MNACEIKTIISDLDKLPYKSILISGPWGVGKSYAVCNASQDVSACIVSLFGIKKTEDIYHNLFFEICGHSKQKAASDLWCLSPLKFHKHNMSVYSKISI